MFITANASNQQVRQVAFMPNWGRAIITVIGPGTVFIATTKESLEMPAGGGQQQGSQFTQPSTTPPKDIPWVGELWALVPAGTSVDFQIPTKNAIPVNYSRAGG